MGSGSGSIEEQGPQQKLTFLASIVMLFIIVVVLKSLRTFLQHRFGARSVFQLNKQDKIG